MIRCTNTIFAASDRCWWTTPGGVLPNIHQVLLPNKNIKKKSDKSSGAKSQEF